VAHRAEGRPVQTGSVSARAMLFRTGHVAAEPTIALNPDGIFFAAADLGADNGVDILRSSTGRVWRVVSPRVGSLDAHPVTLDPYLHVDPETSRLFSVDLTVACSLLSFSDDDGRSWTTNPLACGRPVNDRQTLFTGRPVSSTVVGYPNVVYYCFNDVTTSSCAKSLDGGLTFTPTGQPAFTPADWSGDSACTALHGHGVTDRDGTLYLPKAHCGQPWLAVSGDEGLTWRRVQVARNGVPSGDSTPSVAIDTKGNAYYAWIGGDRLPYMAVSRDRGATWSRPAMIGHPRIREANLVTIAAGSRGRIAAAYVASENSPYQDCRPGVDCNRPYSDVTWDGYITVSGDVLVSDPVFQSVRVNPGSAPFVEGRCGPGRCYPLWDFIDVVIDERGRPWAAYVDGDADGSVNGEGVVATVTGGPPLR
jgi:hypothetical protein